MPEQAAIAGAVGSLRCPRPLIFSGPAVHLWVMLLDEKRVAALLELEYNRSRFMQLAIDRLSRCKVEQRDVAAFAIKQAVVDDSIVAVVAKRLGKYLRGRIVTEIGRASCRERV